ncbi:hypothetical protein L211DRAFT_464110 [Terfezia boudieri ATCC MYA-4762]|uniref:Uncharacterized protein n=1 Tax=Terfezia boudieri ATCC MYA-4762 TaxID=1051890 RepID=A0A3N4LDQ2_9PEZI|nr:hypothetical protein L211DRAFT_464110 [Terfezia boudieri ATCC MYA-4762]
MRTRAQTRFNRENAPLPAPLAQARPEGPPTAKPRPGATSAHKSRTTTRSARKRKAQADKIPPRIIEYLNSVHPTQWSFDDAKAYMKVEGLGTKIKWELKAKLEEIVNSSNDGERCQAAIRVLQKMNLHRAFSTPAATFRVNSGTSSTIIYAPGSSGTIINGIIPPSTTVASATCIGDAQNDSVGLQGSPAHSDSSNPKYGPSDVTSFSPLRN